MHPYALALIGISAFLHALWNFLAKRARNQVAFMFWIMTASAGLLLPVLGGLLVYGAKLSPWYWPLAGGACQAFYCYLLGRGYACGDLSEVYPLARGLAPVLIALLAWPLLHEPLTWAGGLGIALVVGGTLVLNSTTACDLWNGAAWRAWQRPAARWALAAAVMIAAYHLVDKAGAKTSSPLAYLSVMHLWLAAFLAPLTLAGQRPAEVLVEWRRNWRMAIMAAIVCFVAYFLAVTAMMLSPVAYIAALRNLSILLGVFLGAMALRERYAVWRFAGAALMLAGILVIAWRG